MAITRLQQARQMRKGGGIMGSNAGSMLVAPTRDGSRPGYYGPDFGHTNDPGTDFGKDSYGDGPGNVDFGVGSGENNNQNVTYQDVLDARPDLREGINNAADKKKEQQQKAKKEKERIDKILAEHRGKTPAAYNYGPPIVNPYGTKFGPKTKKETTASKMRKLALKNLIDKKMGNKSSLPSIFEMGNLFNPSMVDSEYTYNSPITTKMMEVDPLNYMDEASYGITGKNLTDIDRMNRAIDQGRSLGNITQTEFEDAFYGDKIPPHLIGGGDGGGGGQEYLPYIPPSDDGDGDGEEEKTFDYRFGTPDSSGAADVTRGSYIFNQGGRVPRAFGGIMDTATGRRAYGLGSIFKSVARAAKKVLKSDIGKMAILAAGAYYMPGYGIKATGDFGNMFKGAKLAGDIVNPKGAGFFNKIGSKLLLKDSALGFTKDNFSMMKMLGLSAALPFIPGLNKAPENENIGMADRGGRLIDPLTGEEGTPQSMRENIELAKLEAGDDPVKLDALNQAYNNMLFTTKPYENYGIYAAANGGRIGFAFGGQPLPHDPTKPVNPWTPKPQGPVLPNKAGGYGKQRVMAEEGGLMNLGGMEKDYRAEGGFVPIGKQEKADDVPARLSVNEFVFTADAVRNAGGGDIDKGAEVMENMMKNLEKGGRISEESQGNTGAQEMFSVSERIGEVI